MNVTAAGPADFTWLIEATQCALTPGARAIKATDAAGKVRGMVAYDWWTESACYAHMAVDTPVAWRSLVRPAFMYPFVECDRRKLLALIPSHNTKSWGLAKHFGFTVVHAIRDGWAVGDDLLLLEMRREDCRFLRS